MPTWTLEYQIGIDTLEDFFQEQQVFRSDPLCMSYQSTDSAEYPGRISVRVEFRESIGTSSLQILQRRLSRAVPAVRANPVRVEEYQDPAVFSRADLEAAQVRIDNFYLLNLGQEVSRSRQQLMADGDAQVFAALDAIGRGEIPLPSFQKDPEPRPTFKTRYQRILSTFKNE